MTKTFGQSAAANRGRPSPCAWRARLGLELRVIGPAALVPAVALPIAGALLVVLLAGAGRPSGVLDSAAGLVLEGVCPLGTAVAALSLVGRDRGIEMVLGTPTPYRPVLFARAGIVVALGAVTSFLVAIVFYIAGVWPLEESTAGVVLAWAAPMVWLGGIGLLAAVAAKSAAVGSGLVGALWLAEILGTDSLVANPVLRAQYLYTTHIHLHGGAWVVNRLALFAVGAAALGAAGALLNRPERLLTGEAS
jgi:hypothetical protein